MFRLNRQSPLLGFLSTFTWPVALATLLPLALASTLVVSCSTAESTDGPNVASSSADELDTTDYCQPAPIGLPVLRSRPEANEEPIDDVNWFARPVAHDGEDRIVAFASHDQNYLYNLTTGARVRIPDRSDAVSTPDGRYITVPSYYTPDSHIRFYALTPLLQALESGLDASDAEPAFVHEHLAMNKVYYQSTAVLSEESSSGELRVVYRLMFSGTQDKSQFRIVDYTFTHELASERLIEVTSSEPMALCPEVTHDLNTPFISKDGRYVAAYTSDVAEKQYSAGASLKVFRIVAADPKAGTSSCEASIDFGFAAGKADFSFSGDMLSFHISQGDYLTPFVNGGLEAPTVTDIVVARLTRDDAGNIDGHSGLSRLTTSMTGGVGSYFPAFFPDGSLFYIANAVPKQSEDPKRFHFRVVDPSQASWRENAFLKRGSQAKARKLASLWQGACAARDADTETLDLMPHEAPWLPYGLSSAECEALVSDAETGTVVGLDGIDESPDWDSLRRFCQTLGE